MYFNICILAILILMLACDLNEIAYCDVVLICLALYRKQWLVLVAAMKKFEIS
jgi:hypothetical protein